MEEVSAQNSRAAHDRRHFNNVLLELWEQGKTTRLPLVLQLKIKRCRKSQGLLREPRRQCRRLPLCGSCGAAGIPAELVLDIPGDLPVDDLELFHGGFKSDGKRYSGLRKTAAKAKSDPYLRFTCRSVGRLLLELENPCAGDTLLDENGYPVAAGKVTASVCKSVIAFAKKYEGELIYKIENVFSGAPSGMRIRKFLIVKSKYKPYKFFKCKKEPFKCKGSFFLFSAVFFKL